MLQDLHDPLLDASLKGFPHDCPPLRRSAIAAKNWNVLNGDLPLPLAVIKQDVMQHNLRWMQDFADARGVGLAPHGKTTMSPQLFRHQLDAGAWGMTFATVTQARLGVAAGARRCVIANQVFTRADLQGLDDLRREHGDLQVVFLVDSSAQLALIEEWHVRQQARQPLVPSFDALIEIGVAGGRTGCRSVTQAIELARQVRSSRAVRLVGVECYEGLNAKGDTAHDEPYASQLMDQLLALANACDVEDLFETDTVLITAGGSAIFDLVAGRLKPVLRRAVQGLLRSGCYITHDQGNYKRMMSAVAARTGCGNGLEAALEVWASVQSCPEPGLAILAAGKRDLSYDWEMPIPLASYRKGPGGEMRGQVQGQMTAAPSDWKIVGLNDQHAHLRGTGLEHASLKVGDLVCLGISHPCTTFDKWRWMPLVDANYTVVDAIVTYF